MCDVLYYDGQCGMCRRGTARLKKLDWLDRLELRDGTGAHTDDRPGGEEEFARGIPMRTRDGRALFGFPAMRRALRQTPLGFVPALLMHVPGISHAGAAVYDKIAANRARETVCAFETREE
ncbi:MAG: DUF393 domain-containing protein [Planctomycetota bacterium]